MTLATITAAPATATIPLYGDFSVSVNGSAVPVYRRWYNGTHVFSSTTDQTKSPLGCAQFDATAGDAVIAVTVANRGTVTAARIVPGRRGVTATISGGNTVTFTVKCPGDYVLGSQGQWGLFINGSNENWLQIHVNPPQEAAPVPGATGVVYYSPGTVTKDGTKSKHCFGPGVYTIGGNRVFSAGAGQTIWLADGAYINGHIKTTHASGVASRIGGVRIYGRGVIDGTDNTLENNIHIFNTDGTYIEGITSLEAKGWTNAYAHNTNLVIRGMKVYSSRKFGDGYAMTSGNQTLEIGWSFAQCNEDSCEQKGFADLERNGAQTDIYTPPRAYTDAQNNNSNIWVHDCSLRSDVGIGICVIGWEVDAHTMNTSVYEDIDSFNAWQQGVFDLTMNGPDPAHPGSIISNITLRRWYVEDFHGNLAGVRRFLHIDTDSGGGLSTADGSVANVSLTDIFFIGSAMPNSQLISTSVTSINGVHFTNIYDLGVRQTLISDLGITQTGPNISNVTIDVVDPPPPPPPVSLPVTRLGPLGRFVVTNASRVPRSLNSVQVTDASRVVHVAHMAPRRIAARTPLIASAPPSVQSFASMVCAGRGAAIGSSSAAGRATANGLAQVVGSGSFSSTTGSLWYTAQPAGNLVNNVQAPTGTNSIPTYSDFVVTIQGQNVPVYRVLIARDGRGYPNPTSENCGICQFDITGSVTATIAVANRGGTITARVWPSNYAVTPTVSGTTVTMPIPHPGKYILNINGSEQNPLYLFANPPEVNPPVAGPGVTIYGPGVTVIGRLTPAANTTFYLKAGAVVHGSFVVQNSGITIRGRGILSYELYSGNHMLETSAANFTYEGICLLEAQPFTIRLPNASFGTIDNVKILSYRPNSDGIDPTSAHDITIKNVFMNNWDDGCTVKSDPGGSVYNVTMSDSILCTRSGWRLMGYGQEGGATCYNITFRNIDCVHTHAMNVMQTGTDNNPYLHDWLFEDIRVEYHHGHDLIGITPGEAFLIQLRGHHSAFTFRNIYYTGNTALPCELRAISDGGVNTTIDNVRFENVRVNGTVCLSDAALGVTRTGTVTNVVYSPGIIYVESPNNSSIPPLTQLVDSTLAVWTISGGVVYRNGVATISSSVTLLLYYGQVIYQNTYIGWWAWINNGWVVSSDPRPGSAPSPAAAAGLNRLDWSEEFDTLSIYDPTTNPTGRWRFNDHWQSSTQAGYVDFAAGGSTFAVNQNSKNATIVPYYPASIVSPSVLRLTCQRAHLSTRPALRTLINSIAAEPPPGQNLPPDQVTWLGAWMTTDTFAGNTAAIINRAAYIEYRMRMLPVGTKGIFASCWMFAEATAPEAKSSVEFDVFESNDHDPTYYKTNLHQTNVGPNQSFQIFKNWCDGNFHKYGFLWQTNTLTSYYDDVQVGQVTGAYASWFDVPMRIILDIKCDALWQPVGGYVPSNIEQVTMDIDFVKIWKA